MRRYGPSLCLLSLTAVLLLSRCANIISPEGGPKDITPPSVKECSPPNNSTRFSEKAIRIDFDEFVNVETSGGRILISPPLDNEPDFRPRGKSLLVVFPDKLIPDMTYTIDFGHSISDITENNKMEGFRYAFSTGDILDSLVFAGIVRDAFTTAPAKDVLVMLYKPHNDTIPADSLPLLVRPTYITRTSELGGFVMTNLAPGPYKLIALADKSGDMLFNLAGEQIAFADSLVMPWYEPPAAADTGTYDTVARIPLRTDSAGAGKPERQMALSLFTPFDSTQSLDKATLLRDRMGILVFRYPPENLRLIPLNADSLSPWHLPEPGAMGDTLTLWFNGELPDTLHIRVSADKMKNDTIDMPVKFRDSSKKGKKQENSKPVPLELSLNNRGGIFNHFKGPLVLTASYPIKSMDLSQIRLITGNDSVTPATEVLDSVHRRIRIQYKWTEGGAYQLYFPAKAFQAINGLLNDTARLKFKTAESRNYGNLKINLKVPEEGSQVIVQLLNDNEKVLEEQVVNKTGRISFDYLLPAKYKLKAIQDRNKNRRWDTGDYLRHIQPETIISFPRTLEIRANWDVEESWGL